MYKNSIRKSEYSKFKENFLKKTFQKISNNEINLFEKKIGIILPKIYKEFLLMFNGGELGKKNFFNINKKIGGSYLRIAYGINIDEEYINIFNEKSNYKDYSDLYLNYISLKNIIPSDLVAIGHDDGSNYICIGVNGIYFGKIYFWHHGEEIDGGEVEELRKGQKPFYWTDEMYKEVLDENGNFNEFHNVYLISNSFEEFINGLMTDEEYFSKYEKEYYNTHFKSKN